MCLKFLGSIMSRTMWAMIRKMAGTSGKTTLEYEGSNFFRQRIIISTLSNKPVKIKRIRDKDEDPGVKDFEINLLQLVEKVSNGCKIDISESGTTVFYQPGLLHGGKIEHECSLQRAIGYNLELLIAFAPFCKKPLDVTLFGITNDSRDPSVDCIKVTTLSVLRRFIGVDEGLELKIISRGLPPNGGGEIHFSCPIRKQLKPIQFLTSGKIKRIRGVAYAVRVSPAMANRLVEAAKGILLKFLPDIYIHTDSYKGKHAGKSPGFGILIYAETTEGVFYSAEAISNPSGSDKGPSVPEDVAASAVSTLLEEIYNGGCVDSINQSLASLFMALGPPDVSKLKSGCLTPYTIQFLRHLRDFASVMFKLETETRDEDDDLRIGGDKTLLTCLGLGYTNLSKTIR